MSELSLRGDIGPALGADMGGGPAQAASFRPRYHDVFLSHGEPGRTHARSDTKR